MRQCANCGADSADEAAFCPACGKPMQAAAKAEPAVFPVDRAPIRENISSNVESHLVKAIISTVCCCIPFGVVAIIYAAQVGPNLSVNNTGAAMEASRKANMWGNLAIGIGILTQILWTVFIKKFMSIISSDAFPSIMKGFGFVGRLGAISGDAILSIING